LLKSLTKMATAVRKQENPELGIYHQGLIKMLITAELDRLSIPWDVFSRGIRTKPRAGKGLLMIEPWVWQRNNPSHSRIFLHLNHCHQHNIVNQRMTQVNNLNP